jgi:hypothetical protein
MAENSVVTIPISDGKLLVEALNKDKFRVTAALWLLDPSSRDWRLVLCSPILHRIGPRAAYTRLQKVLLGLKGVNVKLSQIVLVNGDNSLVRAFRSVLAPQARDNRFTNCTFGNVHVDDAFVYYV